jgi:hypothetical protein
MLIVLPSLVEFYRVPMIVAANDRFQRDSLRIVVGQLMRPRKTLVRIGAGARALVLRDSVRCLPLDNRGMNSDKPAYKSARTLNMDLRVIMKIEVLPKARDGVEAVCEKLGMTHVAVNSRLVDWLAQQPDMIKASVLGLLPAGTNCDVAKVLLKRMAGERKSA